MTTCSICCEDYNKLSRKKTACPFCDLECCLSCQKYYLLDTFGDPHCMSCKRGYLREHLIPIFPKTFIANEYKKHRESILFEREKCMLPATQVRIEIDNEKSKLLKSIYTYRKERSEIREEMDCIKYQREPTAFGGYRYIGINRLTDADRRKLKTLSEKLAQIHVVLRELNAERYRVEFAHLGIEQRERQEKRQFIKKCPGEGCNGFLSTQWKCSLCGVKVCNNCLEVKKTNEEEEEKEHVCKPENVETAKLINSETKPCPACGIRIYKLAGCSQMWCTSCHVAFDWKSLRIVTGMIHNPHYYEYQRSVNGGVAPRVPGDVPCCEQIPPAWTCSRKWKTMGINRDAEKMLLDMHRQVIHTQDYEIPALPNAYTANDNEDIRKRFLNKVIDENRFKWFLQKREKARNKKKEIRQLLEMFVACSIDMLRKSLRDEATEETIHELFVEFRELSKYLDQSAMKIYEYYGGVVPQMKFNDSIQQMREGASWCVLGSRDIAEETKFVKNAVS
jgi:hypothetical protein